MAYDFKENTYAFDHTGFKIRHLYKEFDTPQEAIEYAKKLMKENHLKGCIAVSRYAYTYMGSVYMEGVDFVESEN